MLVSVIFIFPHAAGKLVDNKIPWRGDSALKDGSPASLDLSKGLIAKALSSCSASTGDIISTTERLKQELNENFFKALSYVQEIHANCKVLIRTHHQDFIAACWFRADGHDWLCIKKELMSAYADFPLPSWNLRYMVTGHFAWTADLWDIGDSIKDLKKLRGVVFSKIRVHLLDPQHKKENYFSGQKTHIPDTAVYESLSKA
ncbi:hypothetical protein RIF29_25361 [Crotalaria pallida]|uniref:Uncharacterized protein n=1 Tax=Crotalaria pallida TaxID=3830 RepID=A0AAN9HXE6_CROPI